MEQTEKQDEITHKTQSTLPQTAEAKAHKYDASKYERPSVTVDVVMMSLRQRDLQVLLIKRRSWPYEGMRAITGAFVNIDESLTTATKGELQKGPGVQDVCPARSTPYGNPVRNPRTR